MPVAAQRLTTTTPIESDAVEHALTARRPKPRYLCDSLSRVQKTAVAITPTRVNDAVLAAASTSKRERRSSS